MHYQLVDFLVFKRDLKTHGRKEGTELHLMCAPVLSTFIDLFVFMYVSWFLSYLLYARF